MDVLAASQAGRQLAAPRPLRLRLAATTLIARFRAGPSAKVVTISASEVGAISAPPMPWAARAARGAQAPPRNPAGARVTAHPRTVGKVSAAGVG